MSIKPTVFIVDDDPVFSESLAAFVLSMGLQPRLFSSGVEYLNQFDPKVPGILILDVRMPNISGLAMQERLAKEPLAPPIIMLTGHADVPTAVRAMRRGAIEFLQKTLSDFELREAILRAVARDAENRSDHQRQVKILERLDRLSQAEREVLELVLTGMPNKSIATKLAVSRRAVEDRRARLMQKLEVESLPELVRFAIDAGIKAGD
jgi:FixJ family two-component response regulator